MAWHDDDFPEESTDPGRLQPVAPASSGVPTHAGAYPQSAPGYPQQAPQGYPQQAPQGYQQPAAHAGQPGSGTYPAQPMSGAYPTQPGAAGGYTAQPQSGGYQVPVTGGYPAQPGYAPQTGGYPAAPSAPVSGSVPVLQAPKVAIEEEAKASRVVYGLSGTAAGGIIGVILGVLNTQLEGQTILQGTEFILQSAIWCAFIVGALAFWKPERFVFAIERFTNKDDDE